MISDVTSEDNNNKVNQTIPGKVEEISDIL